jgi:hypothetical protein
MSTTQTVLAVNQLKGPHQGGELHAFEIAVLVDGTYATDGGTFDVLAALQAQHEGGITAVAVKAVTLFQDYNDGTNRYTAPNADTTLSGTGNKTVTFELWTGTGATNGDEGSGSEVTNTTAVHGVVTFIVVTAITGITP